ncbi:hypothetical protein [Microbacterium sp. CH12i]|nr:hypothetical protein [Microbacterium sp. CH12i]
MRTSQTSESTPDVDTLAAPAGLNLLGDPSVGACCGGGSCSMPGA